MKGRQRFFPGEGKYVRISEWKGIHKKEQKHCQNRHKYIQKLFLLT